MSADAGLPEVEEGGTKTWPAPTIRLSLSIVLRGSQIPQLDGISSRPDVELVFFTRRPQLLDRKDAANYRSQSMQSSGTSHMHSNRSLSPNVADVSVTTA